MKSACLADFSCHQGKVLHSLEKFGNELDVIVASKARAEQEQQSIKVCAQSHTTLS